jgi:hypothetical protein
MAEILATTIFSLHIIVIAIDCAGAIVVLGNRFKVDWLPRWQRIYLGIIVAKSLSLLLLESCPLTTAENFFRRLGSVDTAYDESFVGHYLPGLPAEVDLLATCLLMLAGLVAVLGLAKHQINSCLSALPADPENLTS